MYIAVSFSLSSFNFSGLQGACHHTMVGEMCAYAHHLGQIPVLCAHASVHLHTIQLCVGLRVSAASTLLVHAHQHTTNTIHAMLTCMTLHARSSVHNLHALLTFATSFFCWAGMELSPHVLHTQPTIV